jgi:methylated-DNA-[protein]-cysteine S-methyltransferase
LSAYYTHIDSPLALLILVSDGTSLMGLYMVGQDHMPSIGPEWIKDQSACPFRETREQLASYFRGERRSFDVPLAPRGTEFQQAIWAELQRIPYGETTTYGEMARRLGSPGASRAVGLANGRNPIGIIVPCHRVIGARGELTGYAGGLARKEALLAFEQSVKARGPRVFTAPDTSLFPADSSPVAPGR